MINFAIRIIKMIYHRQNNARVGLIAFAKAVLLKVNLSANVKRGQLIFLLNLLRDFKLKDTVSADTNLAAALKTMKEMFIKSELQYGYCSPHYAFVISHSKSINYEKTKKYAKQLRLGNSVFSIGIGTNIRFKEMRLIASQPYYEFLFLTNFRSLYGVIGKIYIQICGGMYKVII